MSQQLVIFVNINQIEDPLALEGRPIKVDMSSMSISDDNLGYGLDMYGLGMYGNP